MGIIFGKKKPPSRITQQDKAVLQLKNQRDKLKQYQRRIEQTLEKDRTIAKKLLANGQKDRAKLLLRKKRFQEDLLRKTDGQLENLERMTHDIEFAQVELQVVEGLKQGNEALKKVNDALNIADIERIMDETREGIEKQDEINALLSGITLSEEDEQAIDEELAGLIDEELPEVPTEKPIADNTLEENEEPQKQQKEKTKEKKAVAMEA